MRINLTDNNVRPSSGEAFLRKDVSALFPIGDKTIAELCKENENLLIFPFSIDKADDRIGESSVISILNTDDPEKVTISTGNIMGFIGIGDLQVNIKSRFDQGRDNFLLHYMLQRVQSFNLFDLSHDNEYEDVFDFIMFMFPFFLKSALRQGLYREYQNYKHNDANIKGPIDICRHIARNIPFIGNVAYSTREYSQDNNLTELIRHTIEFMKTKRYGQSVLNIDNETAQNVQTIVEHTPLYNKNDRRNIVNKNLRMKVHPYYTEYRPLQTLCLQILRMEEVKYGESDDEVCGILFDGAWLWEEYVNTILRDFNFTHPENKHYKGRIHLFEDGGTRYPDFYKENNCVLDAKYKRLGSYDKVSKVDREDIHQVIAYMKALNIPRGGFVVPLEEEQKKVPTSLLKNSTDTMSIYGIEICKEAKSYPEFCKRMKDLEKVFINSLQL